MKRGEVWWVDFDPARGGENRKIRPAVIVSNDLSNTHPNRLQVVPLTSNTGRLYPSEAMVTVAGQSSQQGHGGPTHNSGQGALDFPAWRVDPV